MANKLHEVVQTVFRLRGRRDNLPINPFAGNRRENFPKLFKAMGYKRGVEIGVREGAYSACIASQCPEIKLYSIDPWAAYSGLKQERQDQYYAKAVENLTKYPNVQIIRKPSLEALEDFSDGSIDFAYIDGDHTFNMAVLDIIYWSKKVRRGGMIMVHDYCNFYRSGVIQAVDAYTHGNLINPWYVTRESLPSAYWENP